MDSSANTVFDRLMEVIQQRKANPGERSYTATLFAGGVDKIGAKVMEEAAEVVEAAAEQGEGARHDLVCEVADLLFHVFVLLGHHDIPLEEVRAELQRRFGTSGLDEKAARTQNP